MPLVTRIPTGYDALTGEVRAWDWREVLTTEIRETMKVLIATEKPFAQKAVDGIRRIVEEAGYELALLEKYTDKAQLLEAVADVDALIIRSDKVTAEMSKRPNGEQMEFKNYFFLLFIFQIHLQIS